MEFMIKNRILASRKEDESRQHIMPDWDRIRANSKGQKSEGIFLKSVRIQDY
jgi:hypothetical protein